MSKVKKISRRLSDETEPRSRARRIRMLLKKNQSVFKDKRVITNFTEPVLLLIRRSRAVEFFEDASKGSFVFRHSDRKIREIYLEPSGQVDFDYGKKKFKGYICHEDFPLPLPEIPIVTAGTVNDIVEKSMMDTRKLDERRQELKLKTWKTIGYLIGLGIIILIVWQTGLIDRVIDMVFPTRQVPVQSIQETIVDKSLDITAGFLFLFYRGVKGVKRRWKKRKFL